VARFDATVHQNPYLALGETVVHAIVGFAAEEPEPSAGTGGRPSDAVEVIAIDCSASMASPPGKLQLAQAAAGEAIDRLRDGTWFAIVAGTSFARVVYPPQRFDQDTSAFNPSLARTSGSTRQAAKQAVMRLAANGGTAISSWLALSRRLFEAAPDAIHHATLLTDGNNESEDGSSLTAELQRCAGEFTCDCLGLKVGAEGTVLRTITGALLGRSEIVTSPERLDAVLASIAARASSKLAGGVELHVLTPPGGGVKFINQVTPEIASLTETVAWRQPYGRDVEWRTVQELDRRRPLLSAYPIAAWASGEEREYHVCLFVRPPEVGEGDELKAGGVSLVLNGSSVSQASVRVLWTDDERSTQVDRVVAHYIDQEELATSIEEGLEARRAGDHRSAIQRLGRAAQLAQRIGSEHSIRLLERVVHIEDAEQGRVRLRSDVSSQDEIKLDTGSRRTVRLREPPST
jgi:von Willebrand factor type A C-terminal domain/von Willebrand factor type A domain